MITPREQAAWEVAHAALASAYDVTVRETLIDFHDKFPTVDALSGVYVGPQHLPHRGPEPLNVASLPVFVWFDAVRFSDRVKARHEVKPQNVAAIDAFLTHRLCSLPLPASIEDAIYRATSDDGLIWISNFTGETP